MDSKVVVHQSRKKALIVTFLSPILAIIGWFFMVSVSGSIDWTDSILDKTLKLYISVPVSWDRFYPIDSDD